MKIRTDFVTNSSSSNFSIVISVETTAGETISFEEDPMEYYEDDGGTAEFNGDLSGLLSKKTGKIISKYASVESLARYLMDAVSDDFSDEFCDEEDCEEDCDDDCEDDFPQEVQKRKKNFVKQLKESASSISDIAKISVQRDYSAYGEFADMVADNDAELCELAEIVASTTGEEQEDALQAMRKYIEEPNGDRACGSFGCGFENFYYNWHGDDDALIRLAERLCSGEDPDFCMGVEYQELDVKNGNYSEYARFDLR